MQVQDLKRWHWVSIALVVGMALSYVWSTVEWGVALPTLGQAEFEQGLVVKYPQAGHIANVTVLPPQEGKYKVVCEQLRRTRDPKVMEFRPVAYMADAPYQAAQSGQSFPTVRAYLKSVKEKGNPELKHGYAWYYESWAIWLLWTGASLLLIGGVWPSVVSLLTGGGLGLEGKPQEPKYDLDRFGKGQEPAKAPTARPTPTAADMDELARLEKELEQKLASGEVVAGPAGTVERQEQEIKKLSGGPLEEIKVEQEEVEKEYGGEFYPVVRAVHAKKKTGEGPGDHGPGGPKS